MWETKIGQAVGRHFHGYEDDHSLYLDCRRCGRTILFTAQAPLVYVLGEAIHHLQHVHGFPGAVAGWTGYLDDLPAPPDQT